MNLETFPSVFESQEPPSSLYEGVAVWGRLGIDRGGEIGTEDLWGHETIV